MPNGSELEESKSRRFVRLWLIAEIGRHEIMEGSENKNLKIIIVCKDRNI